MTYSQFLRCLVIASVTSSMVLTGCAKGNAPAPAAAPAKKAPTATGDVEAKPQPQPEITTASLIEPSAADVTTKLPIFEKGYTDSTVETFVAYVTGESSTKKMQDTLSSLNPDQFVAARVKIQTVIRQMDQAKVYTDSEKARVAELSKWMNDVLAKNTKVQQGNEREAYTNGALIGVVAGALMAPAVISEIKLGLRVAAERSPFPQIRNAINTRREAKFIAKNPQEFVHPAKTPMVQFARLAEATAAHTKSDKAFFVELLGQATLTDTRKLRNVDVHFLGEQKSIKRFLDVDQIDWQPTHLEGVMQANTGKRVVYQVTNGEKVSHVGFKDLGQEVTRGDAGTIETRRIVELIELKRQKETRLQEMAVEHGRLMAEANAKSNNRVGLISNQETNLAAAERLGQQMKVIGDKWLNGTIDDMIKQKALASAEARYPGKVELLARKRQQLDKFIRQNGDEDQIVKASQQGQARKQQERDEKAMAALSEIAAQRKKLNEEVAGLQLDVDMMDTLRNLAKSRAEAKAEKSEAKLKEVADEVQKRIDAIDARALATTKAVIENEIAQAPRASAHLANQPFSTTLARSGSLGNETVSIVVPGHPYAIHTGLNVSQIAETYPNLVAQAMKQTNGEVLAGQAAVGAVAASGALLGAIVIGGGIDVIAIEDGWTEISPADLEALVKSAPAAQQQSAAKTDKAS